MYVFNTGDEEIEEVAGKHTEKNWLARLCEYTLCGVFTYCWSLLGMLVLVIFVSTQENQHGSCVLTYSDSGAVTEAMMLKWTKHAQWPLSPPAYDTNRQACVCGDTERDPIHIPQTSPVAVWIAPGDLVDLYSQGFLNSLPDGFVSNHYLDFAIQDHVKVCLEHQHLVQLWGTDASNHHCHFKSGERVDGGINRFYLGNDGALFCTNTHQYCCKPSDTCGMELFTYLGVPAPICGCFDKDGQWTPPWQPATSCPGGYKTNCLDTGKNCEFTSPPPTPPPPTPPPSTPPPSTPPPVTPRSKTNTQS